MFSAESTIFQVLQHSEAASAQTLKEYGDPWIEAEVRTARQYVDYFVVADFDDREQTGNRSCYLLGDDGRAALFHVSPDQPDAVEFVRLIGKAREAAMERMVEIRWLKSVDSVDEV